MSVNKQKEEENKPEVKPEVRLEAKPEPEPKEENKPALTKTVRGSEEAKEETKKPKEQFYTVKELGELLFINTNSIRLYIRKGKIKALKIGGRGWRISPAEVERLKAEDNLAPGKHLSKTAKPSGYTRIRSQKERKEPVEPVKAEKPKETEKEAKPWYSIGGLDW